MTEHTAVGKFLGGKKVVDVSADSSFVNFYFEDGSYQTAPIVEGEVKVEFDEVKESNEINDNDLLESELVNVITEDNTELGFYKTLQPIPYTDEEGKEIGKTEVGSIQEVPVVLGEMWIAQGWAEKVEEPE